jgi:site-specific DNA-methyltransferase (cytosine-N4-specific)
MNNGRKVKRGKLKLAFYSGPVRRHDIVKEGTPPLRTRAQRSGTVLPLPFRQLHEPSPADHPSALLRPEPAYATPFGAMVCGDATTAMAALPTDSVDLVVTSPPYALHFKKEYGNADKAAYVEWFRPFAVQMYRVLKPDGSFVLNIGGSYNPGAPTRSLYHFRLLLMLCDEVGFHLAQECFWYNPAKLPSPAEWVNVRRIRIKDSVEYIWWLSKTAHPKADNRQVLEEYSDDMRRLLRRGYRAKKRPSGHNITNKFSRDHGGAIPSNVLARGNNESNSEYLRLCEEFGQQPHPARFPAALPEFYIKFLTRPGDLIVDPFAGSNTAGAVAERLQRRWLSFEVEQKYVENSRLRFGLARDTTPCFRA